ncbi:hypothetical protein D6T64_07140 [Cryobacterium melibiosiphilum]|uniref:Uncharacterized protein n=1 Tax=Cryobacterium melibiosiphilum TaxID=995039 RepID=A0A3A5MGS6_9MICO|nr:hypothetical protein [Cryobacterium melibiosiphilum]RJT89337.1 hypothetical protein D6T64_07140 [Cryobacterium melibiosiphilum]
MTLIDGFTETAASARPRSAATRIWNVVRLHLVDRRTYIGIPWLIVGMAFIVTVFIAQIIGFTTGGLGTADAIEGQRYSWAVMSPQWYLVVVGVQAISFGFPLALGYGVTRRDFYLGTALLFVLISAGNAIAFAVLTQLEQVTEGWWIDTYMFNALWLGLEGFWVDLFSFFVMQLLVFFVGASVATIYMRWRMPGMLVFWSSLVLLIVATVTVITFTSNWIPVSVWFGAQGIAGIFGWLLIPAAIAGVGGFLALRRATPKN